MMMTKWKTSAMGLILVIVIGALISGPLMSNVEHPQYVVTEKHKSIELRDYSPRTIAQVSTSGTREEAISSGFRQLADYIFGNNIAREFMSAEKQASQGQISTNKKIAMTAPVEQSKVNDTWTITFTMPSEHTLETLPSPKNAAITLSTVPPQSFIAIQFSGTNSTQNIGIHENKLRSFCEQNNIKIKNDAIYAFYNPPWTLPILRRNEVMFPIDED
jgi:hypothetical protein